MPLPKFSGTWRNDGWLTKKTVTSSLRQGRRAAGASRAARAPDAGPRALCSQTRLQQCFRKRGTDAIGYEAAYRCMHDIAAGKESRSDGVFAQIGRQGDAGGLEDAADLAGAGSAAGDGL